MSIISWLNDQSVEGDLRGWNVWWWRAGTGDNGPWRPANTKHCSATLQGKYCHTHPYKWGYTSAPPALLGPTQCAVNKRSLNFSIVVSTEACLGAWTFSCNASWPTFRGNFLIVSSHQWMGDAGNTPCPLGGGVRHSFIRCWLLT